MVFNYKSIFRLNILLITMLDFADSHMTYILSDDTHINSTEECF